MQQIVVVTGAAKGLGASISVTLAKKNYALALYDKDEANLKTVVKNCKRYIKNVDHKVADLSNEIMIKNVITEFKESLTKNKFILKSLVNNVGIGGWYNIENFPIDKWDEILNVNLRGNFLITRELIPIFKEQNQGVIINIASDSAEFGFPRRSAYCASKYGLIGLSNSLREELRDYGIKVSIIYTSRIDTYFNGNIPCKNKNYLDPYSVAEVVYFILSQERNIEIREIKMTSIDSSYGLYK